MKSSLIIQEAKEVKSFIEKNKALPSSCTINGNIYSVYTTSYLFAKLLATKKDEMLTFGFVFWFWKSKNGVEKLFLLMKSIIFA